MKVEICIAIIIGFLLPNKSNAQSNPRLEDPNYMQTIIFDDFNSEQLNRKIWKVSTNDIREKGLFIWADSASTVQQADGDLKLSMLAYPDYQSVDWDGKPISANFIAGQVVSIPKSSYGIFECNATLSNKKGSFPAFWTHSSLPCDSNFNNEIDIVELKSNHKKPTLDNHIFYYPAICGTPWEGFEFKQNRFDWGEPHTFKCIWTPSRIEFWVDETKLKEVANTGQYWYPRLKTPVILSQQITRYKRKSPNYKIVTPQTSQFHWVKVREFILAPEITCPEIIDSTGMATLDVDSLAKNISWQLIPDSLFSISGGTGKTAVINSSTNEKSKGKIIFNFQMPSGEKYTTSKEFQIQ
jgi:beta-glucanase (GH16 family)